MLNTEQNPALSRYLESKNIRLIKPVENYNHRSGVWYYLGQLEKDFPVIIKIRLRDNEDEEIKDVEDVTGQNPDLQHTYLASDLDGYRIYVNEFIPGSVVQSTIYTPFPEVLNPSLADHCFRHFQIMRTLNGHEQPLSLLTTKGQSYFRQKIAENAVTAATFQPQLQNEIETISTYLQHNLTIPPSRIFPQHGDFYGSNIVLKDFGGFRTIDLDRLLKTSQFWDISTMLSRSLNIPGFADLLYDKVSSVTTTEELEEFNNLIFFCVIKELKIISELPEPVINQTRFKNYIKDIERFIRSNYTLLLNSSSNHPRQLNF